MVNSVRDNLGRSASLAALRALKSGLGAQCEYQFRNATSITLWMRPSEDDSDLVDDANVSAVGTSKSFTIPAQPGLSAQIARRSLTSNVATITTRKAHGFAAGQLVRVRLRTADSVFDGPREIATVPSTTTFTFAKTNANVADAVAIGAVEAIMHPGDSITFEESLYEVRGIRTDSLRSSYTLRTEQVQPIRLGV